ncbi:MAG: hypothetical protein ACTSVB_06325 [Candidatus Heimdallarchaeaceae archaeon]
MNMRLLFTDINKLATYELKTREEYCLNLITVIESIKGSLPENIENSKTWKTITEITSKYYTVTENGEISYKSTNTQISPEDLTRIALLLFPELLQAQSLKGDSVPVVDSSININKLKTDNPDPNEFLKLLPKYQFLSREPYVQFFNFFGYLVCTKHTVFYENSKGNWVPALWSLPGQSGPTIVKDIVQELASLWIPWLILRSENIKIWLENYIRLDMDLYTTEGIKQLIETGNLPADIERILSFTLEDIKKGIKRDPSTGEVITISYQEKLLWLFIMESRYGDTITYNLQHYLKAIEDIKIMLDISETLQSPVAELDKIMALLKSAFY